ncbi:hypothetical protein ACFQ05_08610 [Amycolatopsis umgeniensis]|uniref:Acetyltransferase (GNAT) family protein n=1 Tax=Amycolatopsis umgeniensis TaxID=336628 RepID=A0A841B345_9PSEU|nr:hypothetical protein [Amycolatopsis umgeniensis]
MTDFSFRWRDPVTDDEMSDLVRSHGGEPVPGWWNGIRRHSLGWVTARDPAGKLVGFVNVAWDGGDHAFLGCTSTSCRGCVRSTSTPVVSGRPRRA